MINNPYAQTHILLKGYDLIPADVTRELGLQSSYDHVRGITNRGHLKPIIRKCGVWRLSRYNGERTVDEAVGDVLGLLDGRQGSLLELAAVTEAILWMYFDVSDEMIAGGEAGCEFSLSTRQIERALRLGCELTFTLCY